MKRVYLAFGSNVGDREAMIREAIARLPLALKRVSSLYETEPVGFREQGWFLNAVAEFETTLFPRQLLHRLQAVEREMGRRRTIVNGPRNIDIDLLLYGNSVISTAELIVPHPRYRERRFVLEPLAEIAPHLRDPVTGDLVPEMLRRIEGQKVQRWTRQ